MTESKRRKILFLTGTRADFGKLKPLIARVRDCDEFDYQIFVTGMHMLSRYGYTYLEIQKSGFDNYFLHMNQHDGADQQMDIVLAHTVLGLGSYVREFTPDLLVVHGDRIETLAGAIVGSLNNILVAHIEGGEVSGTVDELIRHAVSKLSHIHFVANDEAKRRLIQMGETPESIYIIGSPDIDVMLSDELPPLEMVTARYDIPFDSYGVFIYHPVTTETERLDEHINAVVEALTELGRNFVVIHPNNDFGSATIRRAIEQLADNPHFVLRPSMRFEYFLTLLKCADVIVGNSSAGIREAPVYGVPTVNIGSRQQNRYHGVSVLNVPDQKDEILQALRNLPNKSEPSFHFGSGNAADLFSEALKTTEFWHIPRQKLFRDLGGWD